MSTLAMDNLAKKHGGNDSGHRSHRRLDAFWTPFPCVIREDFLEPQDLRERTLTWPLRSG